MCLLCGYPSQGNHENFMRCMEAWRSQAVQLKEDRSELEKMLKEALRNSQEKDARISAISTLLAGSRGSR